MEELITNGFVFLEEFRDGISAFFSPLAILGIAVCAFRLMTASSPDTVRKARTGMYTLLASFLALHLTPYLIRFLVECSEYLV